MGHADWHHLYNRAAWCSPKHGLRMQQLRKEPTCRMCAQAGYTTTATVVDHIDPHKGDEDLFFDPDNLQSLCERHHNRDKAIQESRGYRQGCDVQGNPIDPPEHWR